MTKKGLLLFFSLMLISMLGVCLWAGSDKNMLIYFNEQRSSPWFIATLMDCYWGFLIFYGWLLYQEKSWAKRIPWLATICCLGNIAVAIYGLIRAARLPADASFEDFLMEKTDRYSS